MKAVHRKALHDLWHLRGQALAIAAVIAAGIAMLVMSAATLLSLQETRDRLYQDYRFSDVWASVKRAPLALAERVAELPGVAEVETRLTTGAKIELPGYPEPIEAKLDNPQALAPALARADLFGLARTAIFEPRRPFLVQTAVTANAAPLLFFPISSAPDAGIRTWLAEFDGVTEGFDHRTLRAWKTAHPGHRSFAVLRHPLLRAYVAFHDRIVSGKLASIRLTLIRAYKAKLPEPGEPFPNLEAEHAAFLVFLRYARLAVLGQAGQKLDSHWASQTAILQSIVINHPVDLVIREDRLPTSLAFLAAETGVTAPPPPAAADVRALAAIHDYRLEHAAQAAYARDYTGFGFGRWRD